MRLGRVIAERGPDFPDAQAQSAVANDAAGLDLLEQFLHADKLTRALRQVAQYLRAHRPQLDRNSPVQEAI